MHPAVFLASGLLDELLGDPEGWPHPVRGIGWLIAQADRGRRGLTHPAVLRALGVLLASILPLLAGGLAWGTLLLCGSWGWAAEVVLGAWMLAGKSLRKAVEPVAQALDSGDLPSARQAVAKVVGRDTQDLDEAETARAALETLGESLCDGVVAPLFWFALLGLPGLWAFKAVSTLDSMVGHREAPWTHFGWASARLDDGLNWIPARLTALLISVAARTSVPLRLAWRDGGKTESPNAGVVEAAFAGALRVQLGGTNWYDGVAKPGPRLGDPGRPLKAERLREGLNLCARVNLLMLAFGSLLLWGVTHV